MNKSPLSNGHTQGSFFETVHKSSTKVEHYKTCRFVGWKGGLQNSHSKRSDTLRAWSWFGWWGSNWMNGKFGCLGGEGGGGGHKWIESKSKTTFHRSSRKFLTRNFHQAFPLQTLIALEACPRLNLPHQWLGCRPGNGTVSLYVSKLRPVYQCSDKLSACQGRPLKASHKSKATRVGFFRI